jgi:homoserine kinase
MIKIKVPATSANMGPGFDCLGVALNIYATFEIKLSEVYEVDGFESTDDNLFLHAYQFACQKEGWDAVSIRVQMRSDIPMTRGLGSSAALIVGGIACAIILNTKSLNINQLINLSNQLEGHPDNVVPAICGGLCASKLYDEQVEFIQYMIHKTYQFVLLIPEFTLSTEHSRNVLPQMISRYDASFNLSQIPFLLDGLIYGNASRLKRALKDMLHQTKRFTLHSDFKIICDSLDRLNHMYYLSGAGPSIMIILDDERKLEPCLENTSSNWSILPVEIDTKGIEWTYEY